MLLISLRKYFNIGGGSAFSHNPTKLDNPAVSMAPSVLSAWTATAAFAAFGRFQGQNWRRCCQISWEPPNGMKSIIVPQTPNRCTRWHRIRRCAGCPSPLKASLKARRWAVVKRDLTRYFEGFPSSSWLGPGVYRRWGGGRWAFGGHL